MKVAVDDILEVKISKPKESEAWWNNFIGFTLEVKVVQVVSFKTGDVILFALTQNAKDFLRNNNGVSLLQAAISSDYVEFANKSLLKTSEKEPDKFELHPKNIKTLREVRVFVATKDYHEYNKEKDNTGKTFLGTKITYTYFKKGDRFEEMFDKPNLILKSRGKNMNIVAGDTYGIESINTFKELSDCFELECVIPTKESNYFEIKKKSLGQQYKRTRRAIADANEKLTDLKFFLDITDED